MRYVFDLDGTLVDSERAVREAYLAVGVDMPVYAWGQPVNTWCTPEQHRLKNLLYPEMLLRYGRPLPLYAFAQRTGVVITGASRDAVCAVMSAYGMLRVEGWGMTIQQKLKFLHSQAWAGVYVDDNPSARRRVMEETGWSSISPKACLRSFSQQAPTPDSPA